VVVLFIFLVLVVVVLVLVDVVVVDVVVVVVMGQPRLKLLELPIQRLQLTPTSSGTVSMATQVGVAMHFERQSASVMMPYETGVASSKTQQPCPARLMSVVTACW